MNYTIYDLPTLPIEEQLYYAAGEGFDGGFTAGSARFLSPEPGGRSFVEIQYAYQVGEWDTPFVSWLMSKINGQLFRYKLFPTPQLCVRSIVAGAEAKNWNNQQTWNNRKKWQQFSGYMSAREECYAGSTRLVVNTGSFGRVLKHGHVIGHRDSAYMIDEISYNDNNNAATIMVNPPLRKTVADGDMILMRPNFVGNIINGAEIRQVYKASDVGNIQPGKIVLGEVIV